MPLRTVGVRLAAEVSGYVNSLRTAKSATKDFVGELDRAAKAGKLDAVADTAGRMGLALVAGFGVAVTAGARFDKEMSAVSAATHASAADMERLRQAAIRAGEDTAFSATEAAQGIEELSKAGIATSDILRGGLAGALDLAAAGELSVGEAAETAASAMTQFKLSGKDVPHIADLLAAGAGKAQGSVHDMAAALNQTGLVAAQMGLSIEETTGTLAAFAHAGLLGSDSGTSFKTMLLRLAAPTDAAAAKMKELGIRAFDAQGKFVGMSKFAGSLQTALAGLTDEQRNAALSIIFGADAIRSSAIVYQQGQAGIAGWIDKVNDQGFAADTAAEKTDNLMGDIERLTGSLESLAIKSSTGASSGLRSIVQAADEMVGSLSSIPTPVQNVALTMAGMTGATLLAAAGALKMKEAAGRLAENFATLGPRGQRAGKAITGFAGAVGKATVALAALQVAGAAIGSRINPQVKAMASAMDEFGRTGKLSGEAARVFGDDIEVLQGALKDALDTGVFSDWARGISGTVEGFTNLGNAIDNSLTRSRERIDAIDQALTQLVAEGKTDEAAAAFDRVAAEGAKFGISVNELKKGLPTYTAAVEEANKAGDAAARVQAEAAVKADLLADGWGDAAKAADGLLDAHKRLTGALLGNVDAQIAFEEAIDVANEEIPKLVDKLKAHEDAVLDDRTALDLNTKAGREVAGMLRDTVDATIEATQKKYDQIVATEGEVAAQVEARKVYERGRDELIKQAMQAGLTEQAAKDLADQWLRMPPLASTRVSTPGLDGALGKVREYRRVIEGIPGVRDTRFRVSGTNIQFEAEGGIVAAQHGMIATSPTVLFGERSTVREAFIPQAGISDQRAQAIGAEAMRWHKASVVPWEQMGAGRGDQGGHMLNEKTLTRALETAFGGVLSRATLRIDDRTGRITDLYVRTG